jgi:hypothetical protein
MNTLKSTLILSLTALLCLYLGLEAGYRIGHNSALTTFSRGTK